MRARLLCAGSHEEERRVDVCKEDEDDDEAAKRARAAWLRLGGQSPFLNS